MSNLQKLPLANLPASNANLGEYERLLSVKLNQLLPLLITRVNNLIDKTTTLPVYANNAAAITGGLVAGDFYRTGANPDPVCIVH